MEDYIKQIILKYTDRYKASNGKIDNAFANGKRVAWSQAINILINTAPDNLRESLNKFADEHFDKEDNV